MYGYTLPIAVRYCNTHAGFCIAELRDKSTVTDLLPIGTDVFKPRVVLDVILEDDIDVEWVGRIKRKDFAMKRAFRRNRNRIFFDEHIVEVECKPIICLHVRLDGHVDSGAGTRLTLPLDCRWSIRYARRGTYVINYWLWWSGDPTTRHTDQGDDQQKETVHYGAPQEE